MSWIKIQCGMFFIVMVLSAVTSVTAGEPSDDEWRPSTRYAATRYVSMQPAADVTTRVTGTPSANGAANISLASQPPDCAGAYREETYTVRRPVVETSYREEQYVRYEPVTAFVPQQLDQGAWVDEQVVRTGRKTTQLRWMQGGWTVDPATGREYWRLPMLRPVRVQQPAKIQNVRVWKPNVVTLSVPKVSYQPRVHVRQVPVQTVRYVEERRVRRVPVGAGCLGAPPACCPSPRTFVNPSPEPALPSLPPGSPSDSMSPSNPPGVPAPPLPRPSIDPRENVPGPFMLPQSQSGEDKIQRTRDLLPDRVAVSQAPSETVAA